MQFFSITNGVWCQKINCFNPNKSFAVFLTYIFAMWEKNLLLQILQYFDFLLMFQNNGTITDFVSFYTLPSTVMHHPVHKSLKAAYSFYNVSTVTPWVDLMQDALIVAKNVNQPQKLLFLIKRSAKF